MSVDIECPSGLQLRIRGLKGKEGKLLADKNAIRQGLVLDNMLMACTEQVIDPGPYSLPNGKLDWDAVLLGDRFFVLLQIRLVSFGPSYSFRAQCSEPMCRERFEYEIDLKNDLTVKPLSAEDRETFQSKGVFSTELSDGKEVRFRLATGRDEKMIARNRTADRALVDLLALRITSIEGVGEFTEADIQSQRVVKDIRAYLEDLEWAELVRLLNALDEHDCGVETEIEIRCPHCGGVQEVPLPFGRNFFLPTEMSGQLK